MKLKQKHIRRSKAVYVRGVLGLAVGGLVTQFASAATQTWDGGANDQNWNNAVNWTNDAFPTGAGSNAIINTAVSNFPIISANSAFTPVDIFVGNGAGQNGRLDHTAGTAATGNGNWFFVGQTGATGTYNLANTAATGGTLTGFGTGSGSLTVGRLVLGGGGAGTATANINTSGTLLANNGGNQAVIIADTAGSTATVNMDNGTVTAIGTNANNTGEMWVGASGNGTWNQSGGTVSSRNWFVVGRNNGGVGTLNLSGGTITGATTQGNVVAGSGGGSTGTVHVSGGTFNTPMKFLVGEGGTGTLNVSGTGLVQIGEVTEGLRLGVNANSNGTVNLNGGTIEAKIVTKGAGTTGTFNFNGGTLKATAASTTFMQGLTAANIQAGGAKFDSNGFNITVGQALVGGAGDGGLAKNGAGTLALTGANNYTGATNVNAGTLAFSTAQSNVGTVTVADNASLSVKAVAAATTTLNTTGVTFGSAGPTAVAFDFNNFDTTAPLISSTGTLTANGTVNVTLANGALLSSGSHTLIDYSTFGGTGTFTGSPFTLSPRSTGNLVNDVPNSALLLNVSADMPVWTGADNTNWQVGSTGANANWKLITAGTPTDYIQGDVVRFDDTASAAGTVIVNINAASVTPSAVAFDNSTKPYVVSSGGGFGIAGTAPVVKSGTESVTFTTANTYTGLTTINAGTIRLGDGTTDGDIASTASITNNGTLEYNRAGAGPFTYANVISGSGAVVKKGAGTQVLGGANTYTGTTTIEGGVLSIAANNNLGANAAPVTLNGGTLRTTAGITNTHPVTVGANGGTINVTTNGQYFFNTANTLLGSGPLTLTGPLTNVITANTGNLRVAQTNSYSGAITLTNGGIFEYGVAGAVDGGATFNIANEGELAVQNNTIMPNAVTVSGGTNSIISFENGNGGNVGGSVTLNQNVIVGLRDWYNYATVRGGTISGEITGTGGITVNSGTGNGGTLTLTNFNSYQGGTTLTASRLRINDDASLGSGAVTIGGANAQLLFFTNPGGPVNVDNAITINAGAGSTAQGVIWVADANLNATVSGPITINAAQGAGGHFAANGGTLTVTGQITSSVPVTSRLGTVVLSNAANSFPSLVVQEGTLKIGAAGAVPATATADLGVSGIASLDLAGLNQSLAGLTGTANGRVTNSGLADVTLTTTTGTTTFAGIIQDGATNKTALAVSSGSLTLSGANTHTGGTTVGGGTLALGVGGGAGAIRGTLTVNAGATASLTAADALGFNAGTSVTQINVTGGTLDNAVAGNNSYLASWTLTGGTMSSTGGGNYHILAGGGNSITSNPSPVTSAINANVVIRGANTNLPINVADDAAVPDLSITGVISNSPFEAGANGITKTGAGRLLLSGVNTYTGGTTVTGGSLLLDNGGSLAESNITITGGTFGAGTTGAGGTINYLGADDTFDLISVSGTGVFDLTNLKVNLVLSGTQTLPEYVMADQPVGSAFVSGTQFQTVSNLPPGWSIDYDGTVANPSRIVLVAIPEPASIVLLGLSALIGLRRRRRAS